MRFEIRGKGTKLQKEIIRISERMMDVSESRINELEFVYSRLYVIAPWTKEERT